MNKKRPINYNYDGIGENEWYDPPGTSIQIWLYADVDHRDGGTTVSYYTLAGTNGFQHVEADPDDVVIGKWACNLDRSALVEYLESQEAKLSRDLHGLHDLEIPTDQLPTKQGAAEYFEDLHLYSTQAVFEESLMQAKSDVYEFVGDVASSGVYLDPDDVTAYLDLTQN